MFEEDKTLDLRQDLLPASQFEQWCTVAQAVSKTAASEANGLGSTPNCSTNFSLASTSKEEAEVAYDNLIQFRKQNVLKKDKNKPGLVEIHHIVPKSCGGSEDKSNKVALLASEHFIAHALLWIIHHDDTFYCQTLNAFMGMATGVKNGSRKCLANLLESSVAFQEARVEFGRMWSEISKNCNSGSKNPNYGKRWFKDVNSKSCGLFYPGSQPFGWILGKHTSEREMLGGKSSKGRRWLHDPYSGKMKLACSAREIKQLLEAGWKLGQKSSTCRSEQARRKTQREIQKKAKLEEQELKKKFKAQKKEAWLSNIQAMADFYTRFGFEATCKKFNLKISNESLLMKFIRCRRLYGLKFESQPGKKRKFSKM